MRGGGVRPRTSLLPPPLWNCLSRARVQRSLKADYVHMSTSEDLDILFPFVRLPPYWTFLTFRNILYNMMYSMHLQRDGQFLYQWILIFTILCVFVHFLVTALLLPMLQLTCREKRVSKSEITRYYVMIAESLTSQASQIPHSRYSQNIQGLIECFLFQEFQSTSKQTNAVTTSLPEVYQYHLCTHLSVNHSCFKNHFPNELQLAGSPSACYGRQLLR